MHRLVVKKNYSTSVFRLYSDTIGYKTIQSLSKELKVRDAIREV